MPQNTNTITLSRTQIWTTSSQLLGHPEAHNGINLLRNIQKIVFITCQLSICNSVFMFAIVDSSQRLKRRLVKQVTVLSHLISYLKLSTMRQTLSMQSLMNCRRSMMCGMLIMAVEWTTSIQS